MPAAELSVANHPHHDATGCIADALGDDGVLRAYDAAARQGRLTREAWEYWVLRSRES